MPFSNTVLTVVGTWVIVPPAATLPWLTYWMLVSYLTVHSSNTTVKNLQPFTGFLHFSYFCKGNSWGIRKFTGFDNFKYVFSDLKNSVLLRTGMKNTLYLYLMETFISIPISLWCSSFVVKKVPGHDFLKVVFFLPSLVSGVVMVLMYKYFCEYALPDIVMILFKKDMMLSLNLQVMKTLMLLMLTVRLKQGRMRLLIPLK